MRGLGRIFKRGSVYWIAYYHRGKEYRESSESESESQAKKLLKKRLGEIGTGKLIGPTEERVTFEELTEGLLRDYQVNKRKAVKIIEYPIKHLKVSFGLYKAFDLTTDRINAHIARRQQEGAKNATINRELAALKRMFSLAVQAGKLSSKPYISTLEENNARQGFLDHGSFLALKENLPEHLKDPVTFLYYSGWRVSEMRALEWRDVDLAGKVIRLRPEISKNKDGRLLPIKGELLEIIERARQKRLLSCLTVFHDSGQPIGSFRKAWKTAAVAAGLGRFTDYPKRQISGAHQSEEGKAKRKKYVGIIVHDLRRSAVRNMVRAGIPERVAMSLSGHKTRAVFDRYNIVSEADLAKATERLHQHLEEQPREPSVKPINAPAKESASASA
jgi:integrase